MLHCGTDHGSQILGHKTPKMKLKRSISFSFYKTTTNESLLVCRLGLVRLGGVVWRGVAWLGMALCSWNGLV
jgi:hypothetical protein